MTDEMSDANIRLCGTNDGGLRVFARSAERHPDATDPPTRVAALVRRAVEERGFDPTVLLADRTVACRHGVGGFNDATRNAVALRHVRDASERERHAVLLVRSIGNGQGTWVDEVYLHVGSSFCGAPSMRGGLRPNGESFQMERDHSLTLITMVQQLD